MAHDNQRTIEMRDFSELGRRLGRYIHWVALGLIAAFVWLELRNAPFERLTQALSQHGLVKLALALFFLGWWAGATDDTKIQTMGYLRDPRRALIGPLEVAGIVVFVAVFAALFALHRQLVWLQVALFVFICVNWWTWRIIVRRTVPIIERTYDDLAEGSDRDPIGLMRLVLVVQYMNGHWQRLRFLSLIALAAVQVGVSLLLAGGLLDPLAPWLAFRSVPGAVVLGYVPGLLLLLYVIVSEVWMKVYRVRIFSDLETLDYLSHFFTLSRRKGVALPTPFLKGRVDPAQPINRNYAGRGTLAWFDETFIR